jgi:ribulose-phosphate 3-epimerase
MMNPMIAPSLLAADFGRLQEEIEMVNRSEADWQHLDIMDGLFVPNISFGFPVVNKVRELSEKPLDIHLMIEKPERYIERFKVLGTYMLTVHFEACTHLHRTLQEIHQAGMKAGVAVNPHTPVSHLEEILSHTDMVLIMTVNPGYGGQTFIPGSMAKIRKLRSMIREAGCSTLIEVDGGVGPGNALELQQAGADVLVAGNSVFRSEDPMKTINLLKDPS